MNNLDISNKMAAERVALKVIDKIRALIEEITEKIADISRYQTKVMMQREIEIREDIINRKRGEIATNETSKRR
jgi:hypothetical protein